MPILLFHGDADTVAPVAVSERFAAALPDLVRFERVGRRRPRGVWNADPARYEAAVTAFLTEVAAGPARTGRE